MELAVPIVAVPAPYLLIRQMAPLWPVTVSEEVRPVAVAVVISRLPYPPRLPSIVRELPAAVAMPLLEKR